MRTPQEFRSLRKLDAKLPRHVSDVATFHLGVAPLSMLSERQ